MCGISGFVAKQGNLISNSIIIGMTDIIRHRGPDDEGFLLLSEDRHINVAGGRSTPPEVWEARTEYRPERQVNHFGSSHSLLAFGHRRLSILDLSAAGHQPLSVRNSQYWIVFNGEIYNFLEIKEKLAGLGHSFSTKTDTEVVLSAFAEWGEACLDMFAGMWAFAIFDYKRDELFLSRDRYGIKPLYYYFSPDGDFYFASEIKQFTALAGWQSSMNPKRVYDHLVYSLTDHTDETMFQGVYQLPAGCHIKSRLNSIKPENDGRISINKWYNIRRDPFRGSFDEAANIFRALFERSVREHLHADVPVGTALSGGLDSSSIVCEINRLLLSAGSTDQQKTYSSCSSDERFSEKKWMDIVVDFTKVNASFIYPSLEEALKLTPDIVWHQDEPYQSQSAFLAFNVFKLARESGVKVLLNGQGADEYLGGYGQFTIARYASMVKHLKLAEMATDISRMKKTKQISNYSLLLNLVNHMMPVSIRRALSGISSSSGEVKCIIDAKRLGINPIHPYDQIPVRYNTVPEISEHLTFYSTLPKYLRWEDRNSMAHSVEARVPFLDNRLVEFTYNLPDNFLEKDGINKRVMREALRNLIPERIKNRKDKMGFATPEENWVKIENPKYFRDKISEAMLVTGNIIKPDAIRYFDRVVSGKLPFDYTYWRIILFSEWIQKFQVKIPE